MNTKIKDKIMCIMLSISTGSVVFMIFLMAVILMGVDPITRQELISGIILMATCLITIVASTYVQYRYLEVKEQAKIKMQFIMLNVFIEIFTTVCWIAYIMQY